MRILVVSHLYLPQSNPRALRWGALAAYWAQCGHTVDVICGAQGEPSEETGIPNLQVWRVGIGPLARLRQHRDHSSANAADALSANSGLRKFLNIKPAVRALAKYVHDCTWKHVAWPDSAAAWYFAGRRKAVQLMKQQRYDGLITVSNPFTSHLIGLHLQRRFPQLPWIADISDPFSFLDSAPANNHFLYSKFNQKIEQRVIQRATSVTVTMRSTLEAYDRHFSGVESRFRVAPPVWSPSRHGSMDQTDPPVGGGRRLIYAGSLYPKLRNPRLLLDTFRRLIARRELADLELHFFGQINGCDHEFQRHADLIGSKIHLHSPVPQQTMSEHVRSSFALVNIGNTISYGLPSKVIEYVNSGRPILNFPPQERDTSTEFLADYPAVFNVHPPETVADDQQFEQLVRFLQNPPKVERPTIDQMLSIHRVDAVAEVYEKVLRAA